MSLLAILTVIFVVLKLLGVIDWSWFAVFLPLIIDIIFSFTVIVVFSRRLRKKNRW